MEIQGASRLGKLPVYLFDFLDEKKAAGGKVDVIDLGVGDPTVRHRIMSLMH